MTDEVTVEIEKPKEKKAKSFAGFRVYEIADDGTPKEIMSGTKEEIDKLDELNGRDWTKTYAIRIGKLGLK